MKLEMERTRAEANKCERRRNRENNGACLNNNSHRARPIQRSFERALTLRDAAALALTVEPQHET